MRMAIGSDERTHVTDVVVAHLRGIGIDVELHGPLNDRPMDWVDVGREVAERVASGACQEGVLFCWTGTGVSIAANKVPGVRAALCADAETARGARAWNQANVLCLSLASTSEEAAKGILDAWFSAEADANEEANVEKVNALDRRYRAPLGTRPGSSAQEGSND